MISRKKIHYPASEHLRFYLKKFGRISALRPIYSDLRRFSGSLPYESPSGEQTLWHTVMYPPYEMAELRPKLIEIYVLLKADGDTKLLRHLEVDRIDFGEFGNSKPFRIRIVNTYNDNFDHYYVKQADASRIYGLELEHILSPNRINYLLNENTLIEEHIAGIPGDRFIRDYVGLPDINRVRIAKEFVKFNQRCFVRLLGDMRTVNYIVDITPDFEETQYRVRPIDFDQQCYEGSRNVYLAQFFEDNQPVVHLVQSELEPDSIRQYQLEERSLIARRRRVSGRRLQMLFDAMRTEELSPPEKFANLRQELADYHGQAASEPITNARSMGELVEAHLDIMLASR
ncbi:hypothetical protein BH23VER1_BH23VER1_14070 [soil metagenome]